ncbi:unnamed protein product, partial [Didymodactylos carnosus]
MKVRANYGSTITYTIDSLGQSASTQIFYWKIKHKQKTSTVEEYFQERYNINLRYPRLPVLKTTKGTYLPMELVDVEPACIRKINDDQRATVTQLTSKKPFERRRQIEHVRNKQQNFDEDPFVKQWGLNIDPRMLIILARVLSMPTIHYNKTYEVTERNNRGKQGLWDAQ